MSTKFDECIGNLERFRHELNIAINLGEFSCGAKTKYATEGAARQAVRTRGFKEIHYYFCPYCLSWHIGRKLRDDERNFPMKVSWDQTIEIMKLCK